MITQVLKPHFLLLIFFFFNQPKAGAQQMPLYSQYMFNRFLLNPAAAGLDGYTTVNLTAREQWLGLPNSPKTYSLSLQTRLLPDNFISKIMPVNKKANKGSRGGRVGLGVNVFNDKTGIINRTGFQFTYAYHLPLDESELSLGLTASAYQLTIDKKKMILAEPDRLIEGSDLNLFSPDFNLGIFYTSEQYYYGLSINQLFQSAVQFGDNGDSEYRLYRHYYITGGYRFKLQGNVSVEPCLLFKVTRMMRPQADISTKVFIRSDYWCGLSFRTGSAFVVMGGVNVDNYSFGYAFDYNLTSIRSHSLGSHEVMLAIKFGDNARRFRWLHRF